MRLTRNGGDVSNFNLFTNAGFFKCLAFFVANFVDYSPSIVAFNFRSIEALFKNALIIVTYFYNFTANYKISRLLCTSNESLTLL